MKYVKYKNVTWKFCPLVHLKGSSSVKKNPSSKSWWYDKFGNNVFVHECVNNLSHNFNVCVLSISENKAIF